MMMLESDGKTVNPDTPIFNAILYRKNYNHRSILWQGNIIHYYELVPFSSQRINFLLISYEPSLTTAPPMLDAQ